MSNETVDRIVEELSRSAERHARAGNDTLAILFRNEAWMRENGNWLAYVKLEREFNRA